MKKLLLSLLTLSVTLSAAVCFSSEKEDEKKDATPGILSAKELAELKENFTDPETKKVYRWEGQFQVDDSLAARMQAKLKKKIPFRLTGALYQIKMMGSREIKSRQAGSCWIYIMDDTGKVVSTATKSLNTMCPS